MPSWDLIGRQGLDFASSAAAFGFGAAKVGTRIGFAITRNVASAAVGATGALVDHAVFGGSTITRPVVGGAVSTVLSFAEQVTLAPIFLSEYITSTSLLAAHSSINVLSAIFPGSSEASFSLASFITLVRHEWNEPMEDGSNPQTQYGLTQVARAIVAWVAIQGVTQEWQEKIWFKHLKEIHVNDHGRYFDSIRRRSRIRVTSDVIFPDNRGQVISADIGEAPVSRAASTVSQHSGAASTVSQHSGAGRKRTMASKAPTFVPPPRPMANDELKSTLRRLSKMVLAGYGGASLLFFGVPLHTSSPPPASNSTQAKAEERELANAIEASEAASANEDIFENPVIDTPPSYSWWDVLLGKHDHEIFEGYASTPATIPRGHQGRKKAKGVDVRIGNEHLLPRFWVLTDHGRGQVVLVLRGTMSLNEIAVDLTCDEEDFTPASTSQNATDGEEEPPLPGQFQFPSQFTPSSSSTSSSTPHTHKVHSGMYRMAKAMGDHGRPVHVAVHEALFSNLGYDLVLCGHSLGAGVAAMLGLMWADPQTCLTVRSSGLPVGRRVSVYCFAPPALTSGPLSQLASPLIVSLVYSHDVVSRLSLGAVKDLKNAAMWLCEEESNGSSQAGYSDVTRRANAWKQKEEGTEGDGEWFIAVRKTLEANMRCATLFPPGRVLWAVRDNDLHPAHRNEIGDSEKLRLFEVLDVEKVFSQIVFAKDMLGAHMPHKYDSVLHDLL